MACLEDALFIRNVLGALMKHVKCASNTSEPCFRFIKTPKHVVEEDQSTGIICTEQISKRYKRPVKV
jgi:hypothetical protein